MPGRLVIAAVILVAASIPEAYALTCLGGAHVCRINWFADPSGSTMFDLGIDISNIPPYKEYVSAFMKKQAPETQHILTKTCQNYLGERMFDATSYNTIQFCRALMGQQ
jgi:hypothetical protein